MKRKRPVERESLFKHPHKQGGPLNHVNHRLLFEPVTKKSQSLGKTMKLQIEGTKT